MEDLERELLLISKGDELAFNSFMNRYNKAKMNQQALPQGNPQGGGAGKGARSVLFAPFGASEPESLSHLTPTCSHWPNTS